MDWYTFPLDDSYSPARQSIYAVRRMHGLARKKAAHLFDKAKGEGLPLSQYDMAEVLLGFSAVCLHVMQREFKLPPFSTQQLQDM
eukprot:g81507.t1